MILCTITTDWITTVVSALGLGTTLYVLWDTRKDAIKVQSQVDSLTKLAKTYEKSRRDDLMPDLVIDRITDSIDGLIINVRNQGKPAYKLLLKTCTVNGVLANSPTIKHKLLIFNQSNNFNLGKLEAFRFVDVEGSTFKLEFEFYNKDNDRFEQLIEARTDGTNINSFPPKYIG